MQGMQGAIILTAGFLILFVGSGARYVIGLTLRDMAGELAMGRGMLGVIVAVYYVTTAIAMYLAGRFVDRWSPRAVLGLGLVIGGIGIGLVGVVSTAWQALVLYGLVFATGNGIASITPVSILVTRHFPAKPGIANGVISAGMCAGHLVVVAVMAAVLVRLGWRPVYIALGFVTLALLPLLLLIEDGRGASGSGGGGVVPGLTIPEVARTRRFWLVMGVYAICGFDDFFVSTHLVAFAQDHGVDTLVAGNLLALIGFTSLLGTVAAGLWSDRSGPWWPVFASFVLRIAAFGLIVVSQSTWSVAIFTIVFGFTFMMTAPVTVIIVKNCFGLRQIGTVTGLVMLAHHGVGGIGAWLGGVLYDQRGSYDLAFLIMLVSSLVATGLLLALMPERLDDTRRYAAG